MLAFLGWIFFSVAAGMFASIHRNRSGMGWFFVAVFFTPLVAFVLLLILRPAAPRLTIPVQLTPAQDRRHAIASHAIPATVCALVLLIIVVFSIMFVTQSSAQQRTFRDSTGHTLGTSTQSGNQTTFRDASGRTTGTAATDSAGTTIFRDSMGRTTGSTDAPRRR
jgi:hypothetical protein